MCIMDAEGASTHRPDVLATGDTNLISYLLELAKQGCDKMIVYAPTENEARRVMNVARRFDIRLAEKYHRLAIEHLEAS